VLSTNKLLIFKFILIVILAIGLYYTWLEKTKIQEFSNQLENKIDTLSKELASEKKDTLLKQRIQELENKLQKVQEDKQKEVKIILPEQKKDYSDIIPKINYDVVPSLKKEAKEQDLKVTPEVIINKEEKEIDGLKIKVETKF
jgi:predicted Holliday junction resolvase-like endonuclease